MPDEKLKDITAVIYFLKHAADDKAMYGSYRADDVLKAACRLFGIDHAWFVLHEMGIGKS